MNSTATATNRSLFRDREAALANSAVLAWTTLAWLASFALMDAQSAWTAAFGVVLCVHAMVLAAYLIHEAAHQTLFALPGANAAAGEAMNFIAGSSYVSFERIRHLHIRHHVERADVLCFDLPGLLRRNGPLRRTLQALEWAYIPATEILMHLQVTWRPLLVPSQRRYRMRALAMLAVRLGLLALLGAWSLRALLLYVLAYGIFLHVLNFFDAFHHTFEQHVVAPDAPLPTGTRDRQYEQANTYSDLISVRLPLLNLLTLNFGYHNAHHHRPSVPWYRLPALHRAVFGDADRSVMPLGSLLRTWHRNRVRRVACDDYGAPGDGPGRADSFVGAHGVSFLTVV
jgi:fatty acid desaturase